jgi:uncharacterized membrane protein
MKSYLMRITGNKLFVFLLILALSAVFYLFNIGFSDMWSDEIYTKSMLGGNLSQFFARFENDLHPPLYYFGLKLFTGLFGLNPVTLRLFSVLGVLSTLLLGYFAGRRVFGSQGALYFCLMLISIPMLSAYSHQARMYTWSAFSVTGVFIYSALYMKTLKTSDLVLLFIFTITAMYMHYYSMVAAFVANLFVFLYLLRTKNKKWIHHLFSVLLAFITFLPWVITFIIQIKKVQHAFWAPEVSLNTILSCFTIPFTEQFWTSGYSIVLSILVYSLLVFTLILSVTKPFSGNRLVLLSVFIFLGTLIVVTIISLFSQPILFSRYVMAIVTMLAVPVTVLFMQIKLKWLKLSLISVILFLGIRVSISNFYFSYGPYKQTIGYIDTVYPEISKILHITEVTAGPMIEYNGNTGLSHYWLKAKMSNVDAFPEIHQFEQPEEFLAPGEVFCAVRFQNLELNQENLERVLSESQLLKTDTVRDNKVRDGIMIQVYLLKYKGN